MEVLVDQHRHQRVSGMMLFPLVLSMLLKKLRSRGGNKFEFDLESYYKNLLGIEQRFPYVYILFDAVGVNKDVKGTLSTIVGTPTGSTSAFALKANHEILKLTLLISADTDADPGAARSLVEAEFEAW